jgi:hypothetical protein
MRRITKFHAIVAAAFCCSSGPAHSQLVSSFDSIFDDEAPLELRISAPLRELSRDDEDRPEYDSLIEFADPNGNEVVIEIEIRVRGRSRRENCGFPPLSLDFPRGDVSDTLFVGQNRLKLVTMCEPSDSFADYLRLEFLIYRMLNELTDRSFRVRWATVEYVYTDTNRPRSRIEPAFLIEADWEVADRLGMETVEIERIAGNELDAQYIALMSMFQFMIGNTDWAVIRGPLGEMCCHNGKVVARTGEPLLVLPYDFDNSGLVSAPYAEPSEILPISSVRQRVYRGLCVANDGISAAILLMNIRRERLVAILDDDSISERRRERAVEYFNEFYEIVNDPEERQEQIYAACLR